MFWKKIAQLIADRKRLALVEGELLRALDDLEALGQKYRGQEMVLERVQSGVERLRDKMERMYAHNLVISGENKRLRHRLNELSGWVVLLTPAKDDIDQICRDAEEGNCDA